MSKQKDIRVLEAQRARLQKRHADLKTQVNATRSSGHLVDEFALKKMQKHKLWCKDVIAAIDARLAALEAAAKKPRLVHQGDPVSADISTADIVELSRLAASA